MPGGGERARMGKMCSYGPWEIPPLFAITVTFQNSAVSVIPAKKRRRVILLSHHWHGSDSERCWGEIPFSKEINLLLIWGVKRKIKSPLVSSRYQRLPLLIGILCWRSSRQSYGLRNKEV